MILRTRGAIRAVEQVQYLAVQVPDFLVPALLHRPRTRAFSTTPKCKSRIGSAPLSLPQEVNLRVMEPPPQRRDTITRTEPMKTVEVKGPLGKPALAYSITLSD